MDVAKTPAILTDCVFDHILKTTERTPQQVKVIIFWPCIDFVLLQSFELNNLIKELLKLTHMSNRLLSIINTCLLKIYPNFAQSRLITIDELQQWDLWPKILTVFGMYVCMLWCVDTHTYEYTYAYVYSYIVST